ncbi:hypothetical protein L7F22_042319 [Adiantum nelumboides]|nr:hypothetical protein [Adiantum nelumboides]
MSGEDEGRQPPQHPYWTRLRQSFGQGRESSSAIEEEEEANQPTPESQYSSSSSDTEDFEQVPEEVPNLELHRGRIPERMQQRGNAPGVDAVIPGGNQDRDGGNHPCTYCGISGHRQGLECPLWCKHRSERGMPIVQYNNRGNQPQQRPPAQLNAVILEEVEPEQPEDYLKTIQQESDDILRADKDCCSKGKTSKHFQCDCTECISIEEVPDDQKIPETMAVTKSGKKKEAHVQEKGEQQPMDWSTQDQIRMGVLKEINSAKKQKEETRRSTLPYAGTNQKKIGWKEPVAVDQEQVKKREEAERMSEEFFEALMNAPTQISLRQILGLVPSFADKFMQKLQNQYGIRNISDVRQEADLVQEPDWAEVEKLKQKLGRKKLLPVGLDLEEEQKQAEIRAEKDFAEYLSKSSRVKQDDLEDMNLGTEGNPQKVRVSANLDQTFRRGLQDLLREYKDVFAWHYSDMKGVDPAFCEHKINLKADAVPVIQQRYRLNPNYAKQVKEELDKLFGSVIDGWYLPAQEVDDMKAELRRQGEQIWMNFGKKMEEVISKPYQIFAKEENSEELLLLQSQLEDLQGKFNFLQEQQSEKEHKKADDSQVDEEFNVKGKRSAVEKFCFDEEPVQQTGEEYESSDLHTLISKIAGDVEKPVKSLEILSDVVITSENVDDKEQDEKQDDVVKEKDELLVDVQNIKEQETVAEQQQDVVMEVVGDVQAIQDVVLYEAEKKDAD